MSHINAGVKILSEIHSSDEEGPSHGSLTISSRPFIELAHLEVLFNRLDSQVVQMMGTRPMTLGRICRDHATGFCATIPPCFTTLEEARNSFDYHWNGCIQLFNEVDVTGKRDLGSLQINRPDREKYIAIFQRWNDALQAFLRKDGRDLDSKSWQGARVLQIMHTFVTTNVEACPELGIGRETVWDKFIPRYKHILALAEEVMDGLRLEARAGDGRPSPNFSLDSNFVAPLYAIAHKCRDPIMRRQAVSLLYASPRQEGIWDSFLAAKVAERLISIEEAGLGPITSHEDVPDMARLNAVDVQFDPSNRFGTITYSRIASPHTAKKQDFVETMEW